MNIYDEYDRIIGKSIQGMGFLTSNDNVIVISNLDVTDKDHLYVFNIAKLLGELTGKEIIVNTSLLNWIKLKLKYPKFKFGLGNGFFSNVNAKEFIKTIYAIQPPVGSFAPWEIYDAYYNPRTKGE